MRGGGGVPGVAQADASEQDCSGQYEVPDAAWDIWPAARADGDLAAGDWQSLQDLSYECRASPSG